MKGNQVISYDNMTKHELERTGFATEAARSHNENYLKSIGVKIMKADVRNATDILDAAQGCDYLIHTAAQPAMTISWEDPELDFSSNAQGTFNVLETARRHKIPVVTCSSVHVYGNTVNAALVEDLRSYQLTPPGIDENYPILGGTITPLHASKGAGDVYTKVYADTYNMDAAVFRLTGIYGTRQFGGEDHGWVANFAIRALLDWPITVFGTGKQARDIIYAQDVCAAFDAFYQRREPGVYNIGGGVKTLISLLDAIDLIGELVGKKPEVNFGKDRHGDLRYFCCDISKARKNLQWEPRVLPREGIGMLLDWISENRSILKGV
jgi:CDP-paratose 2-epimerase